MPTAPAHNPNRRNGFTLVELICVVLILAVTAGLIAPRLSTNDTRALDIKANAIADLFSYIAKQDALSGEPMRLEFDREDNTLELLVLRRANLRDTLNRTRWQRDPLAPIIDLNEVTPATLYLDGGPAPLDRWSVEFPATDIRQTVVLTLAGATASGRELRWYVELLPYETKATIRTATDARDPMRDRSIDLDAVGRGESPW